MTRQMASASRKTTRMATKVVARSKPSAVTPDQLAEQLASNLKISTGKGKQKEGPQSKEERRLSAMRSVNTASQGLSTVVKTGWKRSSEMPPTNKSTTLAHVNTLALSAAKSLKELRELCSRDVDVERAASSVVSKLIALEMYDAAYLEVVAMHPCLSHLYSTVPSTFPQYSRSDKSHALSLPLPSAVTSIDPIILTLASTFLLHSLIIVSFDTFSPEHRNGNAGAVQSFADALLTTPTLLTWIPILLEHPDVPRKHADSLLTRSYTQLIRSSSTCQILPSTVFTIRTYAVQCLVHVSPGIVESNTFWEQATKVGGTFIKTAMGITSENQDRVIERILAAYSTFATAADKRTDRQVFLSGSGFIGFCEHWMEFAKRVGDIAVLNRISDFIRGDEIPSASTQGRDKGPTLSSAGDIRNGRLTDAIDNAALECAKLSAILVQTTVTLEQQFNLDQEILQQSVRSAASALQKLSSSPGSVFYLSFENDEIEGVKTQRMLSKVERALERMRRAAVKVLDDMDSGSDRETADCICFLLSMIVEVLEVRLKTASSRELLTEALDTLFVLSRKSLRHSDPRTYGPAYDYLDRAVIILEFPDIPSRSVANLFRCVSGAFHNLAGTLYQSGRHGPAVRFLRNGCTLGSRALGMYRDKVVDKSDDNDLRGHEEDKCADAWKTLGEQLYRRWELLGVCYSKTGDRKLAREAFIECIKAFPYAETGFVRQTGLAGLSTVFNASPNLKQLGGIIDKITYLGACELFLAPRDVSLRSCAEILQSPAISGALLEKQLKSLNGQISKQGVRSVVNQLLKDGLDIYDSKGMPVRRARALLQCLDIAYYAGPDVVVNVGTPEEIGKEVLELLQSPELREDAELAQFCPQFIASAHLWLAIHAHRRADLGQSTLMFRHSDDACKVLKSLVTSVTLSDLAPKIARKSSPKVPKKVKAGTTKVPSTRRVGAGTGKAARAVHREPVTPKPKARKVLEAVSLSAVTPPKPTTELKRSLAVFDDFEGLLGLLQITASILGLMGLTFAKVSILDVTRRICEKHNGVLDDGYVTASIDLAYEYMKLGKTKKANTICSQILNAVRSGQASDEVCARFFLRYAESLAAVDNIVQSSSVYCEALSLEETLPSEDKSMSSTQRIRTRVGRLERAAMASHVFALIQYSKEDTTTSLDGLLQSFRLWNRAMDTLTRLNPPPPPAKPASDSNPFEMSNLKDTLPVHEPGTVCTVEQPLPSKSFTRRSCMDGLEWRIAEGLLTTLFALIQAYFARGSAREVEYFAQQAQDLAESLNAPASISRALAMKGEVLLHLGQLKEGQVALIRAAEILQDVPGTDTVNIHRLRGDYSLRNAQEKDARQLYEEARRMLEELDQLFGIFDGVASGLRKSAGVFPVANQMKEILGPALLAAVLRQHIWLLRDDSSQEYQILLDRFLALPPSLQTRVEENALLAKLTLHEVYVRCRSDMFLSSLAESTIALPMGMSGDKALALSPSTQDILTTLDSAEKLFWADLSLVSRRGDVPHVRDAAISLALIRALKTSLGTAGLEGPVITASLLDASTAITLRREMLETIQHKFPDVEAFDDLQWPLISAEGDPLPRPKNNRLRARPNFLGDSDAEDEEDKDESSLKEYWESVRVKYESQTLDPPSLSSSQTTGLPSNWTVVHISVTEDKSTLFIARQRGGNGESEQKSAGPLIFCVPLKGRRDTGAGEEADEHLTFEDAVGELKEIVRLSDEGTRGAVNVKTDDAGARAKWWKERGDLDRRMKELVENVEFCWLGAFKTILSPATQLSAEAMKDLRTQFDKVFQRSLYAQDKKTKQITRLTANTSSNASSKHKHSSSLVQRIALDDNLLECFSTLSPKCRDEELEDLVYFVLDLYQFHGVPVAISEVDVDQVVVDLRMVLEEFSGRGGKRRAATNVDAQEETDEHTFLILDKNVQGIPWECIPILRGRSVSRIPSVEFLLDRVEFSKWQRQKAKHGLHSVDVQVDRAVVDPRKAYYILNPSGDLGKTEGRFKEWLGEMDGVGWEGVIGRPPSEQQFLDALTRQDLVVYFGHGGGEQYVRSHKIRHLPRCAATMLWGCSSGALREMGDFDGVGTPFNYMLAGCPTLVANLWDVTDRDIDKFAQSVFDKLRMNSVNVGQWKEDVERVGECSVVAAVAQSRDMCKLKYLTGAAPVVYGVPFYL